MADMAQLERALRNADAAGDVEAARVIAKAIKDARAKTAMSVPERFGMGLVDPIQGGAQLLTKVLPEPVVNAGNRLNNWLADTTGLVARLPEGGVDQQTREREAQYQASKPEGFDWARLAGNIASPVNVALAARAPAAASLGGRMVAGGALGATAAATAPVTEEGDFATNKLQQIGLGGAFGAATPLAVAGLGRVISPKASVDPKVKMLRDAGIRPTIGQTLGGMANRIEEKATSLPLVGDAISSARTRATQDLNRAVAARALAPINEAVPEGKLGRELVAHVQEKLSDAYNALLPRMTVKADKAFNAEVQNLRSMVSTGSIDPNAAKAFNRILQNDVLGKFRGRQALTGQTLKQIESDLGQKISQFGGSTDADARMVADALREVQSSLRGLVERSNPQMARQLKAINQGWANFKRLERAAGAIGAEDGVFTAAQLQHAVKALNKSKDKGAFSRGKASMQDLSDAAKSVLGSKVPDSGTPGRLLNLPNLTAAGVALAEPLTLGAPLAGAAMYTPLAQYLLRGAVAARPQAAQSVAGLLNKSAPMFSPAGGLLALEIGK